ncbi:hypothetical protein [Paenarthrobacter sp. YJN-5]|uniref:hypothetical protein n=1 Tax=unclassified Paenarthrobacter TaxID=2634190 RepID=UPI001877D998|nr:hypothetical protein [Paenarthrobacter sp. YJN-5]QOT19204.1 hypothetical protein HMI59_22805 [Paenarthrobacter sp. YJN-5]
MTTATTASPLESYQHGRDNFLSVVLGAMGELETSVLEFQHKHEGQARSAGADLAEALREKARLERGRLRERAKSYAKALANDILR